jgi:hypothetical protein
MRIGELLRGGGLVSADIGSAKKIVDTSGTASAQKALLLRGGTLVNGAVSAWLCPTMQQVWFDDCCGMESC